MKWELLQQVTLLTPDRNTDNPQSGDRVVDVGLIDVGIVDVLLRQDTTSAGTTWVLEDLAPQIEEIPSDTLIYDAQGWYLGPGLVDLYSHSGEPGFEERETLLSLAQAAQAGGFSQVHLLPTTTPPLDQPALIQHIQALNPQRGGAAVKLHCWAALTQGALGKQMPEFSDLLGAGCAGFAEDGPIQDWILLKRSLEYLKPFNIPVMLWPAHRNFPGSGKAREGYLALQWGLVPLSPLSETLALTGILECVADTGTPVHLMRISTARGVHLIQQAKENGLPVTASTTWMHLLWNTEDLGSYDTALNLNPPLGNPADQAALLAGLEQGVLDAIAVDHTPYTYEEKQVGFGESPPGAIGLELALPLLWQALVTSGRWTPAQLWQRLSTAPLHCLGRSSLDLVPGKPVELTLFDPNESWVVAANTLKSKALNTPYWERKIQGKVTKIYT